jgi:SAM-dependent methyltransferase
MSTQTAYSNARGKDFVSQIAALARYKQRGAETMARVKAASFQRIHRAVVPHLGGTARGLRVVEVGSGQWMANAKLFAALGAEVLAVDPELPPHSITGYGRYARALGIQRAGKTLAGEVLLRKVFDETLAFEAGVPLKDRPFERWPHGAEHVPWADAAADLAISDNVFEHLPDVTAVADELARVVRPGGLVCITIHPFTAFSGGHHPATIAHGGEPFTPTIPAWDHLRERRHPSGVYLNELRVGDFKAILTSRFETLRWEQWREGEAWLTPEIEAELGGYTRDELLTGKIFFVGRRPA